MTYSATNAGRLMDHLSDVATDWMTHQVCEFFGVEGVEDLSKDQVGEIFEYTENEDFDYYVTLALRNIIFRWSNEHDDEDFV